MPQYRVHLDNGQYISLAADSSEEAAKRALEGDRLPGIRSWPAAVTWVERIDGLELMPVQHSYVIEIPSDDMRALLKAEEMLGGPLDSDGELLFIKLHALEGVNNANYDGHFGANIYFTIEHGEDKPERHREIIKVITEHLELCKQEGAA